MELGSLTRPLKGLNNHRRLAAAFGFIVVVAASLSLLSEGTAYSGSTLSAGPRVMAPRGSRIKVQVLNAAGRSGLAAKATRYLRDRGFDVVEIGNSAVQHDTTLVLERSGRMDWARLVARAFGVGSVDSRPDSSRFVDVTVLLGADWTPPPDPFGS